MRINIYAEELTDEVQLITKVVEDDDFGVRTFYGIRLYLHSPAVLHYSEADDDRSAVTFWVPWTKADGHQWEKLPNIFGDLTSLVWEAQDRAAKVEEFKSGTVPSN